MEANGKAFQEAVPVGPIGHLKAVDEHHESTRLDDAGHLPGHLPPCLGGQLVEQEDGRNDVLACIGKRYRLGIRRDEPSGTKSLQMPLSLLKITRREIDAGYVQCRPNETHVANEAPCAAGNIRQRNLPLVLSAHELGNRPQCLPTHGSRAAQEKRLDLDVVKARGLR